MRRLSRYRNSNCCAPCHIQDQQNYETHFLRKAVLGIGISEVKEGLHNVKFPERRLSILKSIANSILIDDSYNSNPASMKSSIDLIASMNY